MHWFRDRTRAAHFLFGVSGRANRAVYWVFWIAGVYYLILTAFAVFGAAWRSALESGMYGPAQLIGGNRDRAWLLLLFLLPFLAALFCVTIRRLHDLGRAGWWSILYVLGPTALNILAAYLMVTTNPYTDYYGQSGATAFSSTVPFLLLFASVALQTWAFIELGCLRGTVGANRYGPDPLVMLMAMSPDAGAQAGRAQPAHDLRPSAAPAPAHCPRCGAAAIAGNHFCNVCGADMMAGTP